VQPLGPLQVGGRGRQGAPVGMEQRAVVQKACLPQCVSASADDGKRSLVSIESLVEPPETLEDERPLHLEPRPLLAVQGLRSPIRLSKTLPHVTPVGEHE